MVRVLVRYSETGETNKNCSTLEENFQQFTTNDAIYIATFLYLLSLLGKQWMEYGGKIKMHEKEKKNIPFKK